jgi:hypothetical protein
MSQISGLFKDLLGHPTYPTPYRHAMLSIPRRTAKTDMADATSLRSSVPLYQCLRMQCTRDLMHSLYLGLSGTTPHGTNTMTRSRIRERLSSLSAV